MPLNVKNYI